MLYSSKDWLDHLKDAPFPTLASTPKQIKQVIHTKSSNYTELANIIRRDPGFSLQVLRAVNQILSRKKIPLFSINQAISLLGMRWVEEHFEHFPQLTEVMPPAVEKAIADCYSRILYATSYAHLHSDPRPNEVATAILLEHVAEISLWLHEPKIAQKVTQLPSYGNSRTEASLDLFQTTTLEDLNKSLLTHWNMPHLTHDQRRSCIKLSCAISQASTTNWYSDEIISLFDEASKQTQQTADELSSCIHAQAAETARNIHDLGLTCPLYNLIQGPPPTPTKQSSKIEHKQPAEKNKTAAKSTKPSTSVKSVPQEKNASGFDILITRAIHQLHKDAGLQRVAFIQLSADGKELRVRKIIDKVASSKLRQLRISSQHDNIFGLLLSKPHQLWMNKENLKKHAQLIPKPISALLDSPEFFISSLFNQQRALGLIFADNGSSGTPLNQTIHTHFSRISQQVSNEAKQKLSKTAATIR
jgi:hypothetical protein